jgi:hypothetical protein
MRSILFFIFIAILEVGCAPSTKVLKEASANFSSKPVSVQDAFSEAETAHLAAGTNISVSVGQVPLVSLGKNNRLVIPLFIDGSKPHIMKVMSYVSRKKDGSYILFYPVLSLVDKDFNAYLTLKPKYEFVFHENVLTNEFEIPAGVERLLIHTDQEYYPGSFEGTTSAGSGPSNGAYGVAGVLGGVVGALILHAGTQGEEKPYKFDEVGVVSIKTN